MSNEMEVDAPEVKVDPRTADPTTLWNKYYSKERICKPIPPLLSMNAPIRADAVRFVCISDTHERLADVLPFRFIPPGDVFIHCGDFTNIGKKEAVMEFNEQIGSLPHKVKIVIAGNHELGFEDPEEPGKSVWTEKDAIQPQGYKLLTNCIYLQNSFTEVYGIRVYGSSFQNLEGWEFYRARGESILKEWLKIPAYNSSTPIDVLLTHTPPLGHNDLVVRRSYSERVGCAELLNVVEKRVRPKFHVFGHIHENNGLTTNDETVFINASICNNVLNPVDSPIIFDIPLPEGQKK
ncbi:calcineurin-like phosphoesterase domain-containing protein [Ditylenchus destructor]|nr:calcineurin-like phosphoesterase domain-containing protein [Ditylenchus destructor]